MKAAHRRYLPAAISVNGQTVPGAIFPDRHDGVALFKELGFKDIGRETWAFWCDWAKVPPVG